MPVKKEKDLINRAFELYLEFNGENFDEIEKQMRIEGWEFSAERFKSKGRRGTKTFRQGWVEKYGWEKSLELYISMKGKAAVTSAESLLFEVEFIRKKIFNQIEENPTGATKDMYWQHNTYVGRTTEILDRLKSARDNYANFTFFMEHLLAISPKLSPNLAKELIKAEEPLIEWAEKTFAVDETSK